MREHFADFAKSLNISIENFPDLFLRPADSARPINVGDVLLTEGIRVGVPEQRFRISVLFNAPEISEEKPAINVLADMVNLVMATVRSFEPFL